MIDLELKYLSEPFLTFNNGQKAIDPRDGLMLFGPFSQKKVKGQKTIGLIGPRTLRIGMLEYLKKLHAPILNSDRSIARPNFPGLETIFDIYVNFENVPQIEVSQNEIDKYLKYKDSHQRVHNWTNLYVDKLKHYANNEETPVDVWMIVIPECIFKYGRPNSKIPKSDDIVTEGLSVIKRNSPQLNMFFQEEIDQLKEAYKFEINFHNQIKAKVLSDKIITQIIRDTKISYEELWDNQEKIDAERKFDSAKAWNISTALYYKLGGLPWKLGAVRENVCYLGLVYKKTDTDEKNKNACCAAQMFLDSGDGMVFRGNVGPWWNPTTGEFHLSKKDANAIITQSLESFYNNSGGYPQEVFIHAKTYFDDTEWEGFEEAAKGKCNIVGVRIRENNTFKLYRQHQYCVPRGMMLHFDDKKAYLWTKGFIPRFQTQIGLETPNPLEVAITRGEADIEIVCKDILGLTKLNYNTCIYGDGVPVTLKFAEAVGEILTSGKDVKGGVLPFKHYI